MWLSFDIMLDHVHTEIISAASNRFHLICSSLIRLKTCDASSVHSVHNSMNSVSWRLPCVSFPANLSGTLINCGQKRIVQINPIITNLGFHLFFQLFSLDWSKSRQDGLCLLRKFSQNLVKLVAN